MTTPVQSSPDSLLLKIYESMKIGCWREVMAFIATHPLQYVITLRQTTPNELPLTIIRKVYAHGGIPAFYSGVLANGSRQFSKAVYRAPLRAGVLEWIRQRCPEKSAATQGAMTSFIVAGVDTIPYCFLQRWMVWTMTAESQKKESIYSSLDFFRPSKRPPGSTPLLRDLFKGFKITYLKQLSSWGSYIILSEYLRGSGSRKEVLPLSRQLYIGAVGGFFNGLCVMPFDRVKSMVQRQGYHEPATFKNMWKVSRQIYHLEGVAGFYRAFGIRLVQSIVIGLFTEMTNERVDALWQKRSSKA